MSKSYPLKVGIKAKHTHAYADTREGIIVEILTGTRIKAYQYRVHGKGYYLIPYLSSQEIPVANYKLGDTCIVFIRYRDGFIKGYGSTNPSTWIKPLN